MKIKNDRLEALRMIISSQELGSQDELLEALKKEGALSFFDYMLYLRNMLKKDAAGDGRLIRHIYARHSYFLIDEFLKNPAKILKEKLNIDVPADMLNKVVSAVKAKLGIKDAKGLLAKLRSFFKK